MTARDGRPIGTKYGTASEEDRKLRRDLTNHTPSEEAQEDMEQLRRGFKSAALRIIRFVPDGREKSLALTKVEEATMWAMAGIARSDYDDRQSE